MKFEGTVPQAIRKPGIYGRCTCSPSQFSPSFFIDNNVRKPSLLEARAGDSALELSPELCRKNAKDHSS